MALNIFLCLKSGVSKQKWMVCTQQTSATSSLDVMEKWSVPPRITTFYTGQLSKYSCKCVIRNDQLNYYFDLCILIYTVLLFNPDKSIYFTNKQLVTCVALIKVSSTSTRKHQSVQTSSQLHKHMIWGNALFVLLEKLLISAVYSTRGVQMYTA